MGTKINLEGKKFGRLTVIKDSRKRDSSGNIMWECQCSCGEIIDVFAGNLRRGNSTRCRKCSYKVIGNKSTTLRKHNMRLYGIWSGMKTRCYDENIDYFDRYGGRGIKVCDKWLGDNGFENFYKWAMESGYKNGLTIDRIDVNGNYFPDNCRWATNKEQQNNRRNNVRIVVDGIEMTIAQAAEKYGITDSALRYRLKAGYSPDAAVRKRKWSKNENK